jgi:hypothetical protein
LEDTGMRSSALGFRAVQVGSKIVRTVVRRFMIFVQSKTKKQDSARGMFVLRVGMHANHPRRLIFQQGEPEEAASFQVLHLLLELARENEHLLQHARGKWKRKRRRSYEDARQAEKKLTMENVVRWVDRFARRRGRLC